MREKHRAGPRPPRVEPRVLLALVERAGLSREAAYEVVHATRCGRPTSGCRSTACWRPIPRWRRSCPWPTSTPASTIAAALRHVPAVIARLDPLEGRDPRRARGGEVAHASTLSRCPALRQGSGPVPARRGPPVAVASDRLSAFDVVLPTPIRTRAGCSPGCRGSGSRRRRRSFPTTSCPRTGGTCRPRSRAPTAWRTSCAAG